jgi:DNA-directed RNA polymerase sigma subunit (sigma70/sigma32)
MSVDDTNLATYLSDVRNLQWLRRSEAHVLLSAGRQGDDDAQRRVVEGHLELAALLALQLSPEWLPPLDAIQEANVVLSRLIDDRSVPSPASALSARILEHYRELERRRASEP